MGYLNLEKMYRESGEPIQEQKLNFFRLIDEAVNRAYSRGYEEGKKDAEEIKKGL